MSNESIPIGNVIHMGLTDGTKSDPISEVAEYFIQERENDLFKIDENYVICININENELLKNLLEETQEDFRRVIKNGIIKALAFYNYERDDTQNIDNAKNTGRLPGRNRFITTELIIDENQYEISSSFELIITNLGSLNKDGILIVCTGEDELTNNTGGLFEKLIKVEPA